MSLFSKIGDKVGGKSQTSQKMGDVIYGQPLSKMQFVYTVYYRNESSKCTVLPEVHHVNESSILGE